MIVNGHTVAFFVRATPELVDYCRRHELKLDHATGQLVLKDGRRFDPAGSGRPQYLAERGGEPPGGAWVSPGPNFQLPSYEVTLALGENGPYLAAPAMRPLAQLTSQSPPEAFAPPRVSWSSDPRVPNLRELANRVVANLPMAVLQTVDEASRYDGRVPKLDELEALTASFAASGRYPFRYIQDGCYARAHLMCEELDAAGIQNGKLFVYGDLHAENDLQSVSWWFHVVPLVPVETEQGRIELRVVDPGLSSTPLTPEEFVRRIARGPVKLDFTGNAQYGACDASGRETNFRAALPLAEQRLAELRTVLSDLEHAR